MSREQIVKLDALLVEVSTDSIKPPVRIDTHHRELSDGSVILLVEVLKSDSVHESRGVSYVRVGNSKRKMTPDEILRLAQRRGQARFRWFDKQTLPETGFGTLDESLWKPLLSAAGAAEPEASLGKLALLAPDENGVLRATVAGVLLWQAEILRSGSPTPALRRPVTVERIVPLARSMRKPSRAR